MVKGVGCTTTNTLTPLLCVVRNSPLPLDSFWLTVAAWWKRPLLIYPYSNLTVFRILPITAHATHNQQAAGRPERKEGEGSLLRKMATENPRFAVSDVSQNEIEREDTTGKAGTDRISAFAGVQCLWELCLLV